ncbi:DNA polymerase III subunit delta, partial [bacterium]|nr:DNA polymerase III subunit delta [bacterium]
LQEDIISIFLNGGETDFNLDVFDNDSFQPEMIKLSCSKSPFMAPKRVVVIKKIDEIDYKNLSEIESIFKKVTPKLVIIFVSYKTLDKITLSKKFYKNFPPSQILELKPLPTKELPSFISKFLKTYKKTIDSDALIYFLDRIDSDLFQIENELLKLIQATSDNSISLDSVKEHSYSTKTNSVFELLESILQNQISKSLSLAKTLFEENSAGEMIRFYSLLNNQFKKIVVFKYFMAKKFSFEKAASEANLNYFQQKQMSNILSSFSKLLKQYQIFLKHEPEIKFGGALSFYLFEKMVYEISMVSDK